MSSPEKRRDMDIMKLIMNGFKVEIAKDDNAHDFIVEFHGPKNTLYEGGIWKVNIVIPMQYPFKSPSLGFKNCIFHPNIDEESGSVCLDVLNQTWSPMFDLANIFEMFLPQLLTYPNPADPLNPRAASLMNQDAKLYETTVRQYVDKYAKDEIKKGHDDDDDDDDDASSLSSNASFDPL